MQKVQTKPEVTVKSDFGRGSQRYVLEWEGYNKEVFDLIKAAGGKYDKLPGAIRGYTWCQPAYLKRCIETLIDHNYIVHNTVNLSEISETEFIPNEYEIIQVTDVRTVIHFEYGPKFEKMVAAIKRIHLDDREFDGYTKDWKIRHTALPTLIWGWKELGLDVQRLEDIRKLVCV